MKDYTSPIRSIFVLNMAGLPLFARYYKSSINKDDSVLLAGFLSAIEVFTTNSLDGKLSDLGLGDRRFFFERSISGYMIVSSTMSKRKLFIDPKQAQVMELLLSRVATALDIMKKISTQISVPFGELLHDFGKIVDSIILESTLEFLDLDMMTGDSYVPHSFSSGKELNSKEFDSLIYLIELKTKKILEKQYRN